MSKILVTGGAGFIGSFLCGELLNQGHRVLAVDSMITGSKKNLKSFKEKESFRFVEADVSKPVDTYLDRGDKYDQIFHMASPASPRGYQDNPIATYMVNSFGTHYLSDYASQVGAVMLYASTSEVYGDPLEHPQKESYRGNVSIRGVRACYDVSKRYGEMVQTVWRRERRLKIRTIRIFNTYGPRMNPKDGRVFPNFITQALANEPITVYGDGSQTRSFCYVSDLVAGIIEVMNQKKAEGKVYNIGNPKEETIIDMANLVKELVGSSSEIVFEDLPEDDPTRRKPDIGKIESEIGWKPKVELKDGLQKTIEYFSKTTDQN
ncbi:NAD-dependent epimerase/dehydratase family protein [Pseudomonadota bacterium]